MGKEWKYLSLWFLMGAFSFKIPFLLRYQWLKFDKKNIVNTHYYNHFSN
jgi:hypothetical protein